MREYKETIIELSFITVCVTICILAFVLPISICVSHNKDREVELEKYRIEMQLKHGDINMEKEVE